MTALELGMKLADITEREGLGRLVIALYAPEEANTAVQFLELLVKKHKISWWQVCREYWSNNKGRKFSAKVYPASAPWTEVEPQFADTAAEALCLALLAVLKEEEK